MRQTGGNEGSLAGVEFEGVRVGLLLRMTIGMRMGGTVVGVVEVLLHAEHVIIIEALI